MPIETMPAETAAPVEPAEHPPIPMERLEEFVETAEDLGETALDTTVIPEKIAEGQGFDPQQYREPLPYETGANQESELISDEAESASPEAAAPSSETDQRIDELSSRLDEILGRLDAIKEVEITGKVETTGSETDGGGETDQREETSPLSPESQKILAGMGEKASKLFGRFYERVYKTPGARRLAGKMEIAYNQFWVDKNQEKAVALKTELDQTDISLNALDQAKGELQSTANELREQGLPGAESLELKIQDLEARRNKLMTERDKIQSKFEAVSNKTKTFTNERDIIADRLISTYEEKLKPIEEELERLQTSRTELELEIEVTSAKHKEQLLQLDSLVAKKQSIEEALRATNMSENDIRKFEAVQQLEQIISEGRQKIAAEQEELKIRAFAIESSIAEADARANPYRDKREEFVRLKNVRPLDIEVAGRQQGQVFAGYEQASAHMREAAGGGNSTEEGPAGPSAPEAAVRSGRSVEDAIRMANEQLTEKYKDGATVIDSEDFLKATRLNEKYVLEPEDFKKILTKYLKLRKIPNEQFNHISMN